MASTGASSRQTWINDTSYDRSRGAAPEADDVAWMAAPGSRADREAAAEADQRPDTSPGSAPPSAPPESLYLTYFLLIRSHRTDSHSFFRPVLERSSDKLTCCQGKSNVVAGFQLRNGLPGVPILSHGCRGKGQEESECEKVMRRTSPWLYPK